MKERFPVIAIDGPAGAGKSTVAKLLAQRLGFIYVNTGAMYRAVAYIMKNCGICDPVEAAAHLNISFKNDRILLDGEDVTEKLYTPEISMLSSSISALSGVRRELVKKQREFAKRYPVVMEGRDIGTVVFPDAEVKLYLTASAYERARRRKKQFNDPRPIEEIAEELRKRDEQDSTREDSPLKVPEDAYVIVTTDLSINEVLDRIIHIVKRKLGSFLEEVKAE